MGAAALATCLSALGQAGITWPAVGWESQVFQPLKTNATLAAVRAAEGVPGLADTNTFTATNIYSGTAVMQFKSQSKIVDGGFAAWSIDPHNRILYDGNGNSGQSVDWGHHTLSDGSQVKSLGYDARTLVGTDGVTVVAAWGNGFTVGGPATFSGDLTLTHGKYLVYKTTNAPVITTGTTTNSVLGLGTGSRVIPANATTLGTSVYIDTFAWSSNTATLSHSNWLVLDGTVMLIGVASQGVALGGQQPCESPNSVRLTVTKSGSSGTITAVMGFSTFNLATISAHTNSYPWDTTTQHTIDLVDAYSGAGNATYWDDVSIWIDNPP